MSADRIALKCCCSTVEAAGARFREFEFDDINFFLRFRACFFDFAGPELESEILLHLLTRHAICLHLPQLCGIRFSLKLLRGFLTFLPFGGDFLFHVLLCGCIRSVCDVPYI